MCGGCVPAPNGAANARPGLAACVANHVRIVDNTARKIEGKNEARWPPLCTQLEVDSHPQMLLKIGITVPKKGNFAPPPHPRRWLQWNQRSQWNQRPATHSAPVYYTALACHSPTPQITHTPPPPNSYHMLCCAPFVCLQAHSRTRSGARCSCNVPRRRKPGFAYRTETLPYRAPRAQPVPPHGQRLPESPWASRRAAASAGDIAQLPGKKCAENEGRKEPLVALC